MTTSPLLRRANTATWLIVRRNLARTLPAPCPYCSRLIHPWQPWDIDHATPVSAGGNDTWANLRPAHRSCNRAAGGHIHGKRKPTPAASTPW